MSVILEKILLEDDFLTDVLENGQSIIIQYGDIQTEQLNKIIVIREKILDFFGGENEVNTKIHVDSDFKDQVLNYSREKFTYLFASEQSGQLYNIVWCG